MTTDRQTSPNDPESAMQLDENTLSPLPGEPGIPNIAAAQSGAISKKGLVALVLLLGTVVAISAVGIQRIATSGKKTEPESARAGDKPSAATIEPRKLDVTQIVPANTANAAPRIPALEPDDDDVAQAIGVRRTGTGAPPKSGPKQAAPEDAPILLVSTRPSGRAPARQANRGQASGSTASLDSHPSETDATDPLAATTRNLEAYQRQLQGLLNDLTRTADVAGGAGSAQSSAGPLLSAPLAGGPGGNAGQAPAGGLFGGQLQGSATPKVIAGTLGNRSLTLPKGTAFTCALKTRLISAASGLVGCQVQRNVFSDDGRVLLIERGSHLDGEYRTASARPGMVRIPVLWTRIRTPLGVTVDIESPATGALGESGVEGYVDMIRLEGGARSACEFGGRPPISALTYGPSIGLIQGLQAAGFKVRIQQGQRHAQHRI